MTSLSHLHCSHINNKDAVLSENQILDYHQELSNNWQTNPGASGIYREFKFENYYQTIAFVNAAAWIVHEQDHHPEMTISYNRCLITFSTHSINSLSINDFICAAKINEIITE